MKLKSILLGASALLVAGTSFGQYSVTTGTTKYVLVEEATGNWCGYCPDGAQDLEQSVKTDTLAIVASWHGSSSCSGSEAMMVTGQPFNCSTGYISGFPMGTVDRYKFGSAVGLSRPWSPRVATRSSTAANFKITMLSICDTVTRKITVKITAKCLVAATGNYRMSLLVCEDSISSAASGYQQSSYLSASPATACNGMASWWLGLGSPISPATKYWHNSVVRALVDSNTSIWGDPAMSNPAVGDSVTKTYSYTYPTTYKRKQMYVIGMVQKYGTTTDDRAIDNSVESKVKLMPLTWPTTSVADVATTMMDVQIYPNPANTGISVKGMLETPSDTKLAIFNAVGQQVYYNEYKAAGSLFGHYISVSDFSHGVYFMTLTTDGGTVTKQFTVNK
jgi:hypothetical protein